MNHADQSKIRVHMSSVRFIVEHFLYNIVIGTLVSIDYNSIGSRLPKLNRNDLETSFEMWNVECSLLPKKLTC